MSTANLSPIQEDGEPPEPAHVIATDSLTDCLKVQINGRLGLVTLNLGACDDQARLYVLMDDSDALRLARALTDAALELVRWDNGGEP